MKTISVSVSERDYEEFRRASAREGRPIAELIREAMGFYRSEKLDRREPLRELPVLVGHRLRRRLPSRLEVYDEMFDRTRK
jgi:hypothetical protein